MNAQTIARELGGASKGANGWWNARCPAHKDHKASLGLHDTDDGGVAYKVHGGLRQGGRGRSAQGQRVPVHGFETPICAYAAMGIRPS